MHACGTPHQDHFLSQVARFDVEENVRDNSNRLCFHARRRPCAFQPGCIECFPSPSVLTHSLNLRGPSLA
jgi:hypothetical protein